MIHDAFMQQCQTKETEFYTSQADGDITLTLPLFPTLKLKPFLTVPCPTWHDFDIFKISLEARALFKILGLVSSPR